MNALEAVRLCAATQLKADKVVQMRDKQTPENRGDFMMIYASYLSWLFAKHLKQKYSDYEQVLLVIKADVAKYEWFIPARYDAIEKAVYEGLDMMEPPPDTGIPAPMVVAIELARIQVGCTVKHIPDANDIFYTLGVWKHVKDLMSFL